MTTCQPLHSHKVISAIASLWTICEPMQCCCFNENRGPLTSSALTVASYLLLVLNYCCLLEIPQWPWTNTNLWLSLPFESSQLWKWCETSHLVCISFLSVVITLDFSLQCLISHIGIILLKSIASSLDKGGLPQKMTTLSSSLRLWTIDIHVMLTRILIQHCTQIIKCTFRTYLCEW